MISSHLEPADARRIFPSWDEPAFKASIALTVTVPQAFLAVSNMPVVSEEPVSDGKKRIAFQPTPRMSRYLFVLAAGELERAIVDADGVTVGVVATPGKGEPGRYALDTELGRHYVFRKPPAVRSNHQRERRAARRLQHHRRELDAGEGRQGASSRLADLAQRQRLQASGHERHASGWRMPRPDAPVAAGEPLAGARSAPRSGLFNAPPRGSGVAILGEGVGLIEPQDIVSEAAQSGEDARVAAYARGIFAEDDVAGVVLFVFDVRTASAALRARMGRLDR